jgi:hypothetical protein
MNAPADQAFVIRFRWDTDPTRERVNGRIEHVRSGRGVRFGSYEEMLAFIHRMLTDLGPGEEN